MKITEIGYVCLRESPLHKGSMIYRHTLIAEEFRVPEKALRNLELTEHQICLLFGGRAILSCKTQNDNGPIVLVATEVVLVFTLEVEHHIIEPSDDPVKIAREKLMAYLEKLLLADGGNDITQQTWETILSIDCSDIYKTMFRKLRDNGNKPIRCWELTRGVVMRIQGANQVLKKAGLKFALKAVEPCNRGSGGLENKSFRLVLREK